MISMNQVRDSIVNQLHIAFPTIRIYDEKIKQGLDESCFFVKIVDAAQLYHTTTYTHRTLLFDVHYFSQSYQEAHDIAEQLFDTLGDFYIDGIGLYATRQSYNIIDDVLHFMIEYQIH